MCQKRLSQIYDQQAMQLASFKSPNALQRHPTSKSAATVYVNHFLYSGQHLGLVHAPAKLLFVSMSLTTVRTTATEMQSRFLIPHVTECFLGVTYPLYSIFYYGYLLFLMDKRSTALSFTLTFNFH